MTSLQISRLQSSRNIQGYIPILHQFQKNIFSALGRFRMNRLNGNVYIPLNSRIHAEQQNSDNYEFLYYLYQSKLSKYCVRSCHVLSILMVGLIFLLLYLCRSLIWLTIIDNFTKDLPWVAYDPWIISQPIVLTARLLLVFDDLHAKSFFVFDNSSHFNCAEISKNGVESQL